MATYDRGLLLLLLVLVFDIIASTSALIISAEDKLMTKLFSKYSKSTRPVLNTNDSVPVNLYMALNQLIDVDEKNQIITTRVWLYQEWNDTRLTWQPSHNFSGLNSVVVPMHTLWCPDTALLNSADDHFEGFPRIAINGLTANLYPNGKVLQVIPAILRTPCNMDITFFPVDIQTCEIEFGLWMYADRQVKLMLPDEEVPQENFITNSEWDIGAARGRTIVKVFSATPDRYTSIIFDLRISRKPLYYTVNLILPCVLVAVLTVVVFALPSDSSEKVNLSISLLLTLYVFSILVAELLPPTSNMIPYLTSYLIFNMVLIGVSVAMTTCVSILCQQSSGKRPVPKWVKLIFFKVLSKVLFIDTNLLGNYGNNELGSKKQTDERPNKFRSGDNYNGLDELEDVPKLRENNSSTARLIDLPKEARLRHAKVTFRPTKPKRNLSELSIQLREAKEQHRRVRTTTERKIEDNTAKIVKYMEILLKKTVPDETIIQIQTDWKLLAMIIDRLLLVSFTLCTLFGGITILTRITTH
ncbi:neuronal acetylcholine receptor subunit beta-3-like [Ptychodera flava]|uniref:neuronal acetylcholine receptor subunit beta-3-like n=1 Tax=Ptychodera flava TaxID=63121 RepID=UPI00396A4FBB